MLSLITSLTSSSITPTLVHLLWLHRPFSFPWTQQTNLTPGSLPLCTCFSLCLECFLPGICMGFPFTSFRFYRITAYQGALFWPRYLKFNPCPHTKFLFLFLFFFLFALTTNMCILLIYNIDCLPPLGCYFHKGQEFSSVLYPWHFRRISGIYKDSTFLLND